MGQQVTQQSIPDLIFYFVETSQDKTLHNKQFGQISARSKMAIGKPLICIRLH